MSGVESRTSAAASASDTAEERFHAIAGTCDRALLGGERYTAWFEFERSDFVRMNQGKVRQAGTVEQSYLRVRLVDGLRHAEHTLTLGGSGDDDADAVAAAMGGLRNALREVADDPHLSLATEVDSTRTVRGGALPPSSEVIGKVLDAARGEDLVGLYAAGPVCRGFASSAGQRNWHAVSTFNLDWSLYHRADKAVKASYAGFDWSDEVLATRMTDARERLSWMTREPRTLAPGRYRAWLAPEAMDEIVSLLRWGAFSGRALATRQSALTRMQGGERLDPRVTIAEDFAGGVAPRFQAEGFTRPDRVPLIERGALAGSLVSPRTAREFDLPHNGANASESPEALSMSGGTLAREDALQALGDGLCIGNLWYLNYSDRTACRMTGMTRFGTFWVENGRIVAPVNVLRFDDSLYRLLGSNLEALSTSPELLLSTESYGSRQLTSVRVPGALVGEMTFTL